MMAFSPPLSYLDITGVSGTTHSYATLQLLDHPRLSNSVIEDDSDQMRIFKNGVELIRPGITGAEYSVNEATKQIILTTALIPADRLVIVRQTRQDRPYVEFTRGALFNRQPDYNLAVDQMMLLVQEFQEYQQLATIVENNIIYPDITNKEKYQVVVTGSTATVHSYSTIALLPNHNVRHEDQLVVEKNGVPLVLTTDYTVQPAAQTITLVVALIVSDVLKITRQTKRTRHVPSIPDGSSASSDILLLQANQVAFLVQELPYLLGIENSKLVTGHLNPRRKNFVRYSGPGDTFYYGNLPYLQNSQVFVWRDDVLLTEGTDYTNDDWAWLIDLLNSLLAGEVLTIMTVPICTWPEIWFCDWSDLGPEGDDGAPTGPGDPMPTVLVPVTKDFTSLTADGQLSLTCDGGPLIESIRLYWDLTQFAGKVASTATFGLVQAMGTDAGDTVKVWQSNANWEKIGAAPIFTWDILTTTQGNWMITPNFVTFLNQRLAVDGRVYLLVEPEGVTDEFSVVAIEGKGGFNFGPHMSINGAAYPPTGTIVSDTFNMAKHSGNVSTISITTGIKTSSAETPANIPGHGASYAPVGRQTNSGGSVQRDWSVRMFNTASFAWLPGATIISATLRFTVWDFTASNVSIDFWWEEPGAPVPDSSNPWFPQLDAFLNQKVTKATWTDEVVNGVDVTDLLQAAADANQTFFILRALGTLFTSPPGAGPNAYLALNNFGGADPFPTLEVTYIAA